MDGPVYAIIGAFVLIMGAMFLGVWYVESNKHELRLECIKSGGELVEGSCIRNRKIS